MRALLVVVLLALAGCSTPAPAGPAFDGEAAWQFVHDLVTYDNGTARYRVPGTAGHADGIEWLQGAMQVSGWSVARQSFRGEEYLALDRRATSSWNDACPEEDRQQLASLTFHNVFATYGPADPIVWLGAHWESKEDASDGGAVLGANDGASGVGLLLQFMRHVAAGDVVVPFGLGVVFFDGEDGFQDCHPLAGSMYFAQTMGPDLVDRFILLDMVGDADARFIRESESLRSDRALVDLLWKHGRRHAPDAFTDIQRSVYDDHIPFIEAGVRAVDIIDMGRAEWPNFPPYWHTSGDTMDNISASMLGAVGDTLWATLTDPEFQATL